MWKAFRISIYFLTQAIGGGLSGGDGLTPRAQALGKGRIAQHGAQFPADALIVDPARFGHEGQGHRRQTLGKLTPGHARRTRQAERVGSKIEIIAHLHARFIDSIVYPPWRAAKKRETGEASQIVSVNMVGMNVLGIAQNRITATQTLKRQAIGGIDSGRTKNRHANAATRAELPQPVLRIDPS